MEINVGWVVVLQIISGFLGSWIAYSSIATRIQRFGFLLPILASHISSMVLAVVYSAENCGTGHYQEDYSMYCFKNTKYSYKFLPEFNGTCIDKSLPEFNGTCIDNRQLFRIIYPILTVLITISIIISTYYAWTSADDRRRLERSHLVFVYDWFASATGFLDSWLLNNLKTDPYDEIETDWNWTVTMNNWATVDRSSIGKKKAKKHNINKIKKVKIKKEIPRIFASPTLYRETEHEMGQLFVTILRQNRHQLSKQLDWREKRTKKGERGCLIFNNKCKIVSKEIPEKDWDIVEKESHVCQRGVNYQLYDTGEQISGICEMCIEVLPMEYYEIEYNVWFDKCFEHDKSSNKAKLNKFGLQIHKVIMANHQKVDFTKEGFKSRHESYDLDRNTLDVPVPVITQTPYGAQLEYHLPLPMEKSFKNGTRKIDQKFDKKFQEFKEKLEEICENYGIEVLANSVALENETVELENLVSDLLAMKPSPNNKSYTKVIQNHRVDKKHDMRVNQYWMNKLKNNLKLGTMFEDRDDELNYGVFRVHMKDHQRVQAGKRQSQCLYLYWYLHYRQRNYIKDKINSDNERMYLLALDGDIDFHPDAIISVLDLIKSDSSLGSVCGRIAPMGKGLIYYYQMWEYGTGHWLLKSTEDIQGGSKKISCTRKSIPNMCHMI